MLARITAIGGDLYHVTVLQTGEHPDQGLPGMGGRPGHLPAWPERPVDPGFGVGGARPGHRPDQGLPGNPNFPDNSLPSTPPPQLLPGYTLVLVRTADMKWHYAAVSPGTPVQPLPPHPDQGLPGQPPAPDQGLPGHPGVPPRPDQGLPGGGVPPHVGGGPMPGGGVNRPDQGLPPTAQPRR